MSKRARVNSATRSKIARACGVRTQRPLCEAFEPRVLFSTFTVITASDAAGHVGMSLRDAITSANANPDFDTILFAIPGAGTQIITLASALPAISNPVLIDGSAAVPQVIEISGAAIPAASGANGLTLTASNSGIQSLRITNFHSTSAGVGGNGIVVNGSGNTFFSNYIGVGADNLPHGNGGRGVLIAGTPSSGANDNYFDTNTIAFNGDDGIAVPTATGGALVSVGNEFTANSIYSNGGLGIDLEADGVTANDNLDPDAGANGQQNFPVISSVTISGGQATISGTINSTPNTLVYLDFYAGSVAGREGRITLTKFVNSNPVPVAVMTDGSGTYNFTAANAITVGPRDGSSLSTTAFITATATSSITTAGVERLSTSEFSAPVGIAAAPRVQGVYVEGSGTTWADTFRRFMQITGQGSRTRGYAIPTGSIKQLRTLTWINMNQIAIQFTEDVDVQQADLVLHGTKSYTITGFAYDPLTFTGVWTLSAPLLNDKIMLVLDADNATSDGNDGVKDLNGNYLDGEFTNATSAAPAGSVFPSGNGTAGGDFAFRINSVPGDVTGDTGVNNTDTSGTRNRQTQSTSTISVPSDFFIFDVNTDGGVNNTDTSAVRNKQTTSLPATEPSGAFPLLGGTTKSTSVTSQFFRAAPLFSWTKSV